MSAVSPPAPITRRALLGRAVVVLAGASPLALRLGAQQPQPAREAEPLSGQGEAGTLRDPSAAGRPRAATDAGENNDAIQRLEQQLKCTCGCNLDIFTCRTTDFTCTYSPALHREVVALYEAGRTPLQIVDAFVAKYGERILMAPKPVDFNLLGYLLPGAAILTGGAALAWVIGRRQAAKQSAGDGSGAARATRAETAANSSAAPSIRPSDDELARLRRELAEVED